MYACGPTVYNFIHIGNARPIVVFDMLYRLLKHTYENVVYARNITDIDDKINATASSLGETISDVSGRYTDAFHEDIARLHTLMPDIEPFATNHISEMHSMIQSLLDKDHAYVADGHVLFNVPSMKEYGSLSGRNREDLIAGARVDVAPYKRDPADFVLWKPSTGDQPGWDSPWGFGRPGWHLECSAMIETHLGETIDIHAGGQDLIFPHHENEIAQSVCAHGGKEFCRYWVHNGYITTRGEKMSKSVGNFFTLRELLDIAPGEVIRFALLSGHYRKPLDWSVDALNQSRASLDRIYQSLQIHCDIQFTDVDVPIGLIEALEDDLNTPMALAVLHGLVSELNNASNDNDKRRLKSELLAGGKFLGLLTTDPDGWFKWQPKAASGLDEQEIERLVNLRIEARKNKDFAESDRIRDELSNAGIQLEDGANGTTWHRASVIDMET
jgi:cysteinyl-tRNA synthetase